MFSRFLPVFLLLGASSAAAQRTWFVDQLVPGGLNNGQSWTDAFTTLDQALGVAAANDDVFVMTGPGVVYVPGAPTGFAIPAGVDVFGGFTNPAQTTIAARPRSGATGLLLQLTDLAGFGAFHVVDFTLGGTGTSFLDGFVIHAGNANGGGLDDLGGGLLIAPPVGSTRTLRLVELLVRNNQAVSGGGLFATVAKVFLRRVHFNENIASASGGAMFLDAVQLRADDCELDGNQAGLDGGGLFATAIGTFGSGRPLVELVNTLVNHNNAATGNGGGAFLDGSGAVSGKAAFTHSTIAHNVAGVRGGGIFAMTTTAIKAVSHVENSIVWQNTGVGGIDELAGRQACAFSDVPGTGQGCFYLDPLFVFDPIFNTNYDLGPGSPCANSGNAAFSDIDGQDLDGDGITLEPLPLDFANRPRPTGPAVSSGAYER